MRASASAIGSIATAMWNALACSSVAASRTIATWPFQNTRSPRRSVAMSDATGVPSARSCMSLSRGQGDAAGRERDLHQAGAVEAVAGLAAPQIGRAEEALRHRDEIAARLIERRQMARRQIAGRRDREAVLLAHHRDAAAERQRIRVGGSLIEGPGNASVRSAVTLWVGAARGATSAFAGSQPT